MPSTKHRDEDDPLLTSAEAAELLGYTKASSWRSLVSKNRMNVPPDEFADDRSPRWRRSTVEEVRGRKTGQGYRSDLR